MKRIIPVIQISHRKGVKTIQGYNPKYIGCPVNAVKILSDSNASEIIINDIAASKEQVIDFDYLQLISNEAYVPLCYSGGVSCLSDFDILFNMGFEKVACENLLFTEPNIVQQAVDKFGSSSIVGCITLKKKFLFGHHFSTFHSNLRYSIDDYLHIFDKLNIGEILFNNIIDDGTFNGFKHIDYIEILSNLKKPVVLQGGISSSDEIETLLVNDSVSGVAVGSLSCYRSKKRGVLINYPKEIAPHLLV